MGLQRAVHERLRRAQVAPPDRAPGRSPRPTARSALVVDQLVAQRPAALRGAPRRVRARAAWPPRARRARPGRWRPPRPAAARRSAPGSRASAPGAPRARRAPRAAPPPLRRSARAPATAPPTRPATPRRRARAPEPERREQHRRRAAHAVRARDRQRRADRVALVRQRRRAAAPAGGGLGHLPHLGLRHQLHVERDLLERRRRRAPARRPAAPIRTRRVCQGSTGSPSSSSSASSASTRRPSSPSEASVPAAPPSSTSERHRGEQVARLVHGHQPAGRLEPERRRQRLLEQRAGRHRRAAMLGGEPRRRRPPPPASSASISASARRATSTAAVSITSWLVAPRCACRPCVDAPCAPAATAGLPEARPASAIASVEVEARGRGDLVREPPPGSAPRAPAPRAKRDLEVEHRLQPGALAGGLAHGRRDEQRAQTAKKVVSRSPCKLMSNRSPPSSSTATRVARASGSSIEESSGSASLASASSGK